jgi:transposase
MRHYTRIRELKESEHQALLQGTKSRAGFTMRRSHILLLSAEGLTPQQIAQRLHCGQQTVRDAIHAFAAEGVTCLQQKSNRPHSISRAFDSDGLKRLEDIVHRSPRDFGLETSQWTLVQLAEVCYKSGVVQQPISYETVRQGLCKLGIDWQTARHRITSHDPHYERKKTAPALDRAGTTVS